MSNIICINNKKLKLILIKMKFISLVIISTLLILASSKVEESKNLKKKGKQVSFISDRTGGAQGFGSDIGVVIRKTPTVYTDNKMGLPLLEPPQQFSSFSASNTSNFPNLGSFPKSAEIVNPTILFHSKAPYTVVKSTPAHLGYRNEKTTVTSLNKSSGKLETHDITNKVPIYGEIDSVHTLQANSIKQLDLQYRRFRKPKTTLQENGEFKYDRDQKFVYE